MHRWINLISLLALAGTIQAEPAGNGRLDEVAERGRHVMPFSLEKTTHVFTANDAGGVQQVVANDATDLQQIGLIRGHLANLASRFPARDFSGPASIHGAGMPGLQELSGAPAGAVDYRYRELPNGAAIAFVSHDAKWIAAIHRYFQAQLDEHAGHAVSGHAADQMHHR